MGIRVQLLKVNNSSVYVSNVFTTSYFFCNQEMLKQQSMNYVNMFFYCFYKKNQIRKPKFTV